MPMEIAGTPKNASTSLFARDGQGKWAGLWVVSSFKANVSMHILTAFIRNLCKVKIN